MAEYIERIIEFVSGSQADDMFSTCPELVRCRECKFYHEVVGVVDSSELLAKKCCWYFDTWANEVNPDGFCAWGKRRSE